MNYNQIYGRKTYYSSLTPMPIYKRIIIISLLLLSVTFLSMLYLSIKYDQSEVCKRFFSSGPHSEKRFLSHSIEDQFKIHRCRYQINPPMGYSSAMSEGGEKIVPFLVERLKAKHKNYYERDLTILAASEVLSLLAISGDLDNHRYVVPLLERKISRMEFALKKRESLWALETIKKKIKEREWIKQRENIVTGCEKDVANLGAVHGEYGRLVFLSRLGIGEKREELSKKRLKNIALYLKNAWDIKEDRMKEWFIFRRGSKVKAKGRIEIHDYDGRLVGIIVARSKDTLSALNNCPEGE